MTDLHVVVDAANVMGSRPDGWWRDRAGAIRRLAGQLVAVLVEDADGLAGALGGPAGAAVTLHLVREGAAARVADLPTHPRLVVVDAPADGDGAVVGVVRELAGAGGAGVPADPGTTGAAAGVVVVTADRDLRERVRAAGADVVGPGALLAALPPTS